jgi:hypothetical protein
VTPAFTPSSLFEMVQMVHMIVFDQHVVKNEKSFEWDDVVHVVKNGKISSE